MFQIIGILIGLLLIIEVKLQKDSDNLYEETSVLDEPKIYYLNVATNISNRFATTVVTCRMKNPSVVAKDATFSIILPDRAFISKFVMEINNKSYSAFVEEKRKAQEIYDKAVNEGQTAAQVKVNARDSQKFSVNVNLGAEERAIFYLTYEELLVRKLGKYELTLNIYPGQPVKHLNIQIMINEPEPLAFLKAPIVRRSSKINDKELTAKANVERSGRQAIIKYSPDLDEQRKISRDMGTNEELGFSGQFVIQYEVDRRAPGGDIIQSPTHFAHFFVPKNLTALPKYVIFILDTSSSMYGTKLNQLKEGMNNILSSLNPEDSFNIIEFNSNAKVWDLNEGIVTYVEGDIIKLQESPKNPNLPVAHKATKNNIEKSKVLVNLLAEMGLTDIYSALLVGYKVLQNNQEIANNSQTMIMFLTDGEATRGIQDNEFIINNITELINKQAALFTLSLGEDANERFLDELSLRNNGQTKHIYEDDDIFLQLQNFFKDLSSPLLKDIKFNFKSGVKDTSAVQFPTAFKDLELVVVGQKEKYTNLTNGLVDVRAQSSRGPVILEPSIEHTEANMERLWAYLKVKQLLDQRKIARNKTLLSRMALDLALKYSFVTDITSLVVVKPEGSLIADPDAEEVKNEESVAKGDSGGPLVLQKNNEGASVVFGWGQIARSEVISDIERNFTWLKPIDHHIKVAAKNGSQINIEVYYAIGGPCQNVQNGTCKGLIYCTSLWNQISNMDTLLKYTCKLDDMYLGICC